MANPATGDKVVIDLKSVPEPPKEAKSVKDNAKAREAAAKADTEINCNIAGNTPNLGIQNL